jgi:hypothetical protein
MPPHQRSGPDELDPARVPVPPAAVSRPWQQYGADPPSGGARPEDVPVTDFWSLLGALLSSDVKVKRFLILAVFVVATTVVSTSVALGVMLRTVPNSTFPASWVWPAVGAGGIANLLALLKSWLMIRRAARLDQPDGSTERGETRKGIDE